MKKLTKALAAVTAVIMIVTAFAACSKSEAKTVNAKGDLSGAKIGVQLGTTGDGFVTDLEKKNDGTKVTRYKTGFEAVQSLLTGKIDAVVIDNEPAKVFVENSNELKILEEPFVEEEYAICFAKDNTELTDKVNAALAELNADGTIKKILDNYIGDNTGSYQYKSPENVSRTNGTLKMATNAAFAPYESVETVDGKDAIVGIDPDIALAISDKLGMTLEIQNIDFDSIVPAVTSGKADMGMAGLTDTPDRRKNVNFSDSYCSGTQVIIVKK